MPVFDPANPVRRPSWRKAGRGEGFRVVALRPGQVRRLSRKTGEVWVPKAGWVRFRWSRAVPAGMKSGRVRIDRGVTVSAALPTGERLHVPGPTWREQGRLRRLERKLARAKRGSGRRGRVRLAIARLRTRETDRRKDWTE